MIEHTQKFYSLTQLRDLIKSSEFHRQVVDITYNALRDAKHDAEDKNAKGIRRLRKTRRKGEDEKVE